MRRYCSLRPQGDIYPFSQVKLIRKGTENVSSSISRTNEAAVPITTCQDETASRDVSQLESSKEGTSSSEYRENAFKIQMLSTNLHRQLFPQDLKIRKTTQMSTQTITDCLREIRRHGIDIDGEGVIERLEDVELKLPPLAGANIEEHFYNIAEEQVRPYHELLLPLVKMDVLPPPKPREWCFREGWTRYDCVNGTAQHIDYPLEDGLVFDVEVCMSAGNIPTLAVAMGKQYWYSWTSSRLTQTDAAINAIPQTEKFSHNTLNDLIPLGRRKTPKLIVGHNVSYDRARICEEYLMEDFGTRFLDTMSLHICVSGVTSYQRAQMKSKKDLPEEDQAWFQQSSLNNLADVYRLYCGSETLNLSKTERNVFVEGSLDDVRRDFQALVSYCARDVEATQKILHSLYPLFAERFPHPVTLAGMLELGSAYLPINKNWHRYINESDLTFKDLSIEAKYHLARRADEACTLMRNQDYKRNLWLWDEDWSIQTTKLNQGTAKNQKKSIKSHANDRELSLSPEEKKLYEKFQYLYDLKSRLPARRPLLPGYPAWYRKLCRKPKREEEAKNHHHIDEHFDESHLNVDEEKSWCPGPNEISTGMQIAPKLLSLCWEGYPLHYIREHGWGFLVPFKSHHHSDGTQQQCLSSDGGQVVPPRVPIEELSARCPQSDLFKRMASEEASIYTLQSLDKTLDTNLGKRDYYRKWPKKNHTIDDLYKGSGGWCNHIVDDCCFFLKLPHKNGKSLRVGNPLSRDFINKFADNVLNSGESGDRTASRIIEIARMMSYWRNNRDRIIGQMVVWLDKDDIHSITEYGAICPQVVTCGTLTRRAMEPTWMTASNSQKDRIGSELRAMVQAPPDYRIVGADVDSQELWIASVLGDAYAYGEHGATPLGWMTLSGTKSNGTDMHSMTAKAVGISRDHAKVINYARIYGAGQNFAEDLLKQFNPTFSATEARKKAMKMFGLTKGRKTYTLKEEYRDNSVIPYHQDQTGYVAYEAYKLALASSKSLSAMFERPKWTGGSESAMFNCLEKIASERQPVTPFLQCRLSRALEVNDDSDDINRFLPTRVNWVVQSGAVDFLHLMMVSMRWLMGERARFCLSFHDEIRYLVKKDDAYKAALAMHATNLLTRAFCCSRLGLNDVPMSVAFFSSVEVDTVLRKENTQDCVTPSNPHGLKVGYGVHPGESLNIYDAIKKAATNDLSN